MFESAELGHSLDKDAYEREVPELREGLLGAQHALFASRKFAVVILVAGVDAAGKGATVNLLHEWLDVRHVETHAMDAPSDEERERPPMWRFWRTLPPKGKVGIYFGSWYSGPLERRARGQMRSADLDHAIERVVHFEKMLADEGVLLLKFWFHLSKKAQYEKLSQLARDKRTSFRVTKEDWRHHARYDRYRDAAERILRQTSTVDAPWHVIEGADDRYRTVTTVRVIKDAIEQWLEKGPRPPHPSRTLEPLPKTDARTVLSELDLSAKVDGTEYDERLVRYQARMNRLSRKRAFKERAAVLVFEGMDAAGKGGAIRRITSALDARSYHVWPVAAPSDEERAQPYLWRFWRRLPRRGKIAIFDRSWYGRVLVERVEGFASELDWQRAYNEINDFEEELAAHGVVVVKFWLHISLDEQKKRFEARANTSYKQFKLTPEDWRNRKKWALYEEAVCDMVDRTSTENAPWTLVPAEDKKYARLKVLETVCTRLEDAIG
jgi:polyphosphate:AMP phosphotransferase